MAGRRFVIGDIHGCAAELEALLGGLRLGAGDTVIFLGDYVDRGPDSRAVLEQLLALRQRDDVQSVFLKGNHEDMCLAFLGRRGRWGESWYMNGSAATLRSYGLDGRATGPEAAAGIPAEHLAFLESLIPWHETEGYLAVHAGIRPGRPLADQDEEDLFWIREEFIAQPHTYPATVVFGHTPHRQVFADLPYKIGIDTGCVYGGRLTGLELETHTLHQVTAGERHVRQATLAEASRTRRA